LPLRLEFNLTAGISVVIIIMLNMFFGGETASTGIKMPGLHAEFRRLVKRRI